MCLCVRVRARACVCWGLAGRVRGVLRVWCAWCVCPAGGVGVAVSADGRCVCGVSVVRGVSVVCGGSMWRILYMSACGFVA